MRRPRPLQMVASAAFLFAAIVTTSLRASAPDRAAALPMKGTFTELFLQFESPSSVDPRKFTAAMKKAEGAVPNR